MQKRLTVDISAEDQIRMRNALPWGVIGRVMRILLIQVLELVETHGEVALGALLSGKITIKDMISERRNDGELNRP